MAQVTDYTVSNQTFPNTRADLNNIFAAIATNNSGTSAPSNQQAGQWWIDTSSSTWELYIHDGTDDILFATIDTSANTVNFTDSALDVVTDTTPQLGGNLDLNSNDITGTGNINITGNITNSGNLVVDTNTLFVDSVNNIVRIGDNHSYSANTGADELVIGNTTAGSKTGITILSSNDVAFSRGDIYFADVDNNSIGRIEYNHGTSDTDVMKFYTNSTERMRLTSTGNLQFGQSVDDSPGNGDTNTGASINPEGSAFFSRARPTANAGMIVNANRNTTDGDIINLCKDGTTVGSIGTISGTLRVSNDDVGLLFNDAGVTPEIVPSNADGSASDNLINLGNSGSRRFKDFYLGGNIYLGGTGSANALDDYETGTWTPTSFVGAITQSANATYTKIGNRVLLQASNIQFNNSTNNEVLRITGLPFTPVGEEVGGSAMWNNMDSANQWGTAFLESSGVTFYASSVTGAFDRLRHIDLSSTSATVYFQVQYRTNA